MYFSPPKVTDLAILPVDSLKVTGPQIKNPEVHVFSGRHLESDGWLG